MIKQRATSTTLLLLLLGLPLAAQTKVEPGFNLFSPQQDVEIGRQSAQEVERQMPVLDDRRVQNYVDEIGQRLARYAQGPDFPYQFKVVNVSDINAFALPGGFMYVNRGLIEEARSEAELAGVMAHEIGHVALRHGTNQVSKAYLAQAGFSLLGAILGDSTSRSTSQIIQSVGGFGLNALFLKYSRTAETQADIVGAQMLAKAGYDPMAMADFFEFLRQKSGRDQSGLETFFSSHPAPEDRAERVAEEIDKLGGYRQRPDVGGFESIQARLDRMRDAPSMQDLASGRGPRGGGGEDRGGSPDVGDVEPPSSRMRAYRPESRDYRIDYPGNWEAYPHNSRNGVTLMPPGGAARVGGRTEIVYGAIIETSAVDSRSRSRRARLEDASRDLLDQVLSDNSHLRAVSSWRSTRLDRRSALHRILAGRNRSTGVEEHVEVFTVLLTDRELLHILFIVPERDFRDYRQAFARMADSLELR